MEIKEEIYETICDIRPLLEPQPPEGAVQKHQEHRHYKGQTKTNNKRQDGGVDDYEYDELGALVRNRNEEIKEIEWTFARKVKKITRFNWSAKPDVEFVYDALGRRIGKVVKPKNLTTKAVLPMDSWTVTYYALDASGKQFATYDLKFNNTSQQVETVKLNEHHLYGASRLGVAN